MQFINDPLQDIKDYDEWLKNVINDNAPNKMRKKFDIKMKAKLILLFYKRKIKDKTGIQFKKIQWEKLPPEDIIRWNKNEKTNDIVFLGKNHINEILKRMDQLNLSEEFLRKIKQPQKSRCLKVKISEYFRDLLQDVINWNKNIPWEKLTSADFQNWPKGIPVTRPDNLAPVQRKKLTAVQENIKLSDHFKNTYKMRLGYSRNEKRALISRHLLKLIEERVGISYSRLPRIYPEEIVKWPSFNSVNPESLSASDLNYVFQNLNGLDLSRPCIERLKASIKPKSEALSDKLRKHILGMLNEISVKGNNIQVPWSRITSESFTWWPTGIQLSHPVQFSAIDLKKIIENMDKIKFTDKFKDEYLIYNT